MMESTHIVDEGDHMITHQQFNVSSIIRQSNTQTQTKQFGRAAMHVFLVRGYVGAVRLLMPTYTHTYMYLCT